MSNVVILLGVLAACLLIGVPVSYSIGIACMCYLWRVDTPMIILIQRITSGATSFTMLALPMFVFSGILMAYGCTPRLIRFAEMLLRKVPGGLGSAAMLACGFFGAVSGSGVASTAAIGSICGPAMLNKGYRKGLTAGLLAAGGAMASLIPPSINMVVYASASSASIGDLFIAGIVPGVLTIVGLTTLNIVVAKRQGIDKEVYNYSREEKIRISVDAILPLFTPVIVVVAVLAGIFTATEASVVACVYAFILVRFVYKELNFKNFIQAIIDTTITASSILFIIAAATPFGWILAIENVPQSFASWMLGFTNSKFVIFLLIYLLLIIEGCFMETLSIIILMTPLLLPIANGLGMNTVHFGIAMLMNLAVGGCTPPLSVCLFTSCRILKMRIDEAFPDMWWVLFVVALVAAVTMAVPDLSLGLLKLFGKL